MDTTNDIAAQPGAATVEQQYDSSAAKNTLSVGRVNLPDLSAIVDRVCRTHCWRRTKNGPVHINEPLTDAKIKEHLAGRKIYGASPIAPGESTTRLGLLDFDSHKGETSWIDMCAAAKEVLDAALARGLIGIPFRSSGGTGIHLFFIWDDPQDAYSVRELLRDVLANCYMKPGTGGVAKNEAEVFPKQDSVPISGYGSMFILPLASQSEYLPELLT